MDIVTLIAIAVVGGSVLVKLVNWAAGRKPRDWVEVALEDLNEQAAVDQNTAAAARVSAEKAMLEPDPDVQPAEQPVPGVWTQPPGTPLDTLAELRAALDLNYPTDAYGQPIEFGNGRRRR